MDMQLKELLRYMKQSPNVYGYFTANIPGENPMVCFVEKLESYDTSLIEDGIQYYYAVYQVGSDLFCLWSDDELKEYIDENKESWTWHEGAIV